MELSGSSFADWYRAEHPRVLGSITALSGDGGLAAEVTDEAFTRALADWPRVQRMASPAGWTYRVALNVLRRKHRRRGTEQRALSTVGTRADGAGRVHTDPTSHPEVWAAVRQLPEKQRVAVVLRYVADLTESAIAETMGVSRGTVASNLSDARRSLAEFLTDDAAHGTDPADPHAEVPR